MVDGQGRGPGGQRIQPGRPGEAKRARFVSYFGPGRWFLRCANCCRYDSVPLRRTRRTAKRLRHTDDDRPGCRMLGSVACATVDSAQGRQIRSVCRFQTLIFLQSSKRYTSLPGYLRPLVDQKSTISASSSFVMSRWTFAKRSISPMLTHRRALPWPTRM